MDTEQNYYRRFAMCTLRPVILRPCYQVRNTLPNGAKYLSVVLLRSASLPWSTKPQATSGSEKNEP